LTPLTAILTATYADPHEVKNWTEALERTPESFPYIQSTKSLIGHCLGAAGAIESVAAVLQLYKRIFCILQSTVKMCILISKNTRQKIPQKCLELPQLKIIAKAGFGFGDCQQLHYI